MDGVRRALGRQVRKLRTAQGLSQEQLGERADLHWTHISGIERAQYDLKLSTLTRDRQVVVFTHDDRLPASVRRMQLEATVIAVTRKPGSVVECRPSRNPIQAHLSDGVEAGTAAGSARQQFRR